MLDLDRLQRFVSEEYLYLTTQGRKSGNKHTVELWFGLDPARGALYILSGGGTQSDWVKNLIAEPEALVRIGTTTFRGRGRTVESESEALRARELVVAKYYHRAYNPHGGWEAQALPVAVDLTEEAV